MNRSDLGAYVFISVGAIFLTALLYMEFGKAIDKEIVIQDRVVSHYKPQKQEKKMKSTIDVVVVENGHLKAYEFPSKEIAIKEGFDVDDNMKFAGSFENGTRWESYPAYNILSSQQKAFNNN